MPQKKQTGCRHDASGGPDTCHSDQRAHAKVSNEYVLNIAFYTFIGFTACQFVFALLAESQAMLADSEAMSIDALTYLFNMCAERIKNQPISTENDRELSVSEQEYKRNLRRLYLELFPPLISVICLFAVTVTTMQEASQSLWGKKRQDDEKVSLSIMLIFSALNLLLDVVNVSCFARANMNFGFGLDIVRKEAGDIKETVRRRLSGDSTGLPTETSSLLSIGRNDVESAMANGSDSVNLNMCSAWTVSDFDSLLNYTGPAQACLTVFLFS